MADYYGGNIPGTLSGSGNAAAHWPILVQFDDRMNPGEAKATLDLAGYLLTGKGRWASPNFYLTCDRNNTIKADGAPLGLGGYGVMRFITPFPLPGYGGVVQGLWSTGFGSVVTWERAGYVKLVYPAPGVDYRRWNARNLAHECCHAVGLGHSTNGLMYEGGGPTNDTLTDQELKVIIDGFTAAIRQR